MKGFGVAIASGLLGLVIGWNIKPDGAAGAGVEKRIDWRPADRYEMMVAADGNVWRLDKATGTIHVVCGNVSFDVPEYREK